MLRYRRFSDNQKSQMWERWRQGDTLREIARLLERPPSSVFKQLSRTGGMQPSPRTRSSRAMSLNDRAIPGHWEGDLIVGTNNSYIATLVERHSRLVMLAKVEDKTTDVVMDALIKQAKKLPSELYKSLTLDRGSEFAAHKRFTIATGIDIYFCDPQSPWQRGSNENTNRLLRQYFPKGTDLSVHSQTELNRVARQLNERPRKTLDYETQAERFEACRAATS